MVTSDTMAMSITIVIGVMMVTKAININTDISFRPITKVLIGKTAIITNIKITMAIIRSEIERQIASHTSFPVIDLLTSQI